jgi:type IV pilus assembly protein PilB
MSSGSRTHRRRIGEILVNEGLITADQLDEALKHQRKTGDLLGAILLDMGLVAEADVAKTICIQFQLPFVCLTNYDYDSKLVQLFPAEFLHRHRIYPFDKIGDMLLILVTEIPPDSVLEEIPKLTKLNLALYVGYASEVMGQLRTLAPLGNAASEPAPAEKSPRAEKKPVYEPSPDESEEHDGTTLVFGSNKESFLEELDSTWDAIFQQAQAESKTPPAAKKK